MRYGLQSASPDPSSHFNQSEVAESQGIFAMQSYHVEKESHPIDVIVKPVRRSMEPAPEIRFSNDVLNAFRKKQKFKTVSHMTD